MPKVWSRRINEQFYIQDTRVFDDSIDKSKLS